MVPSVSTGNVEHSYRASVCYRVMYSLISHLIISCFTSFELVKSMLPEEHHKVLVNIRKAEARTKRRKQAAEEEEDSESEEEAPKTKSER